MEEPKKPKINVNDPMFVNIENSLIKRMTIAVFGMIIESQENPVQFYKEFLADWESQVAETVQKQTHDIDIEMKKMGLEPNDPFMKLFGLSLPDSGDIAKKASDYMDLIKDAYLKPIHDRYSDK